MGKQRAGSIKKSGEPPTGLKTNAGSLLKGAPAPKRARRPAAKPRMRGKTAGTANAFPGARPGSNVKS